MELAEQTPVTFYIVAIQFADEVMESVEEQPSTIVVKQEQGDEQLISELEPETRVEWMGMNYQECADEIKSSLSTSENRKEVRSLILVNIVERVSAGQQILLHINEYIREQNLIHVLNVVRDLVNHLV
ncbi:hypothetical protein NDU88_003370 [Pleurodeles waltl]|uniref:Uncharacterized protein n=1 Tax=Pleurodeles waltl TaxID=8319 RepID=A0AAV7QBJ1_PLEWA|nr:hypothetical protein NDU88_003370 [Pleurodeles waltl]